MSSYPKKIFKKNFQNFFSIFFFSIFWLAIIGTVHLDVRITVWVRSYLRIMCSVWTATTTTIVVVRTLLWCGNSLLSMIYIIFYSVTYRAKMYLSKNFNIGILANVPFLPVVSFINIDCEYQCGILF